MDNIVPGKLNVVLKQLIFSWGIIRDANTFIWLLWNRLLLWQHFSSICWSNSSIYSLLVLGEISPEWSSFKMWVQGVFDMLLMTTSVPVRGNQFCRWEMHAARMLTWIDDCAPKLRNLLIALVWRLVNKGLLVPGLFSYQFPDLCSISPTLVVSALKFVLQRIVYHAVKVCSINRLIQVHANQ